MTCLTYGEKKALSVFGKNLLTAAISSRRKKPQETLCGTAVIFRITKFSRARNKLDMVLRAYFQAPVSTGISCPYTLMWYILSYTNTGGGPCTSQRFFKNGRSQAVRIPKDFAYEGVNGTGLSQKVGEKLILEPVRKSWLTLYDEIEPLGADDDFSG